MDGVEVFLVVSEADCLRVVVERAANVDGMPDVRGGKSEQAVSVWSILDRLKVEFIRRRRHLAVNGSFEFTEAVRVEGDLGTFFHHPVVVLPVAGKEEALSRRDRRLVIGKVRTARLGDCHWGDVCLCAACEESGEEGKDEERSKSHAGAEVVGATMMAKAFGIASAGRALESQGM